MLAPKTQYTVNAEKHLHAVLKNIYRYRQGAFTGNAKERCNFEFYLLWSDQNLKSQSIWCFHFLNSPFKYESTSRDWLIYNLFPVPVLDRGTWIYRVYSNPSSSDKSFPASIFPNFLSRGSIHGEITQGSSSQWNQESLTLGPIFNEIERWGRLHNTTRDLQQWGTNYLWSEGITL